MFASVLNNSCWVLTKIYAPCNPHGKSEFVRWFKHISMPDSMDWLIVGDFNLYRNPEDRNRDGANYPDMLMFNDAVNSLGLIEPPLKGQRFTWTNKQHPPLLERLDWFFTSISWTTTYPNTSISTLVMETSDHVPCLISISMFIPKGSIFWFENYWLHHEDFFNQVQLGWYSHSFHPDPAKNITARFKNLRSVLRGWRQMLSNLNVTIKNVKLSLTFLNLVEEFHDLSVIEWNLLETKGLNQVDHPRRCQYKILSCQCHC